MDGLTKRERNDVIMRVAMEYACTLKSIRDVAKEFDICKTTVHLWLNDKVPLLDPQLSKIVRRKISLFKVQNYNFNLTSQEIKILKAKKRSPYWNPSWKF